MCKTFVFFISNAGTTQLKRGSTVRAIGQKLSLPVCNLRISSEPNIGFGAMLGQHFGSAGKLASESFPAHNLRPPVSLAALDLDELKTLPGRERLGR